MTNFLLDTNVVSEFTKKKPNDGLMRWLGAVSNDRLFLSCVTLCEMRTGIELLDDPEKRDRLERWLSEEMLPRFHNRLLVVDAAVAVRWGRLEARSRRGSIKMSTVDGILAATALQLELTLVTRNERDFAQCGVAWINPWT